MQELYSYMNILVLGSGGREHALSCTFHNQGKNVYCLPGNGGTESFCEKIDDKWKNVHLDQHEKLLEFSREHEISLVVVGPETPLANGIVDFFTANGVPIFGPTKQAAKLECSKVHAKAFMDTHGIPTAESFICTSSQEALDTIHRVFPKWEGVVIKPDGLTAGKGVTICKTLQEANTAVDMIMEIGKYGPAGNSIIVEELMTGPEVSILAFCDGKTMIPMIPSQDHKRLLEGNHGPNTGGVGAYAPLPFLSSKDLDIIHNEIIEKTNLGLIKEGIEYTGILYFGLMLTKKGPKVLEFNCRFGDPEAQVVLPLLESDLAEVVQSCINGKLHTLPPLRWKPQSACGIVLYSDGYPGEYRTGFPISGIEEVLRSDETLIFHSGTKINDNKQLTTAGGRVLTVTALGNSLQDCVKKAYQGAEKIEFRGAAYRKDIASQCCK